jgi:hypothetical protein
MNILGWAPLILVFPQLATTSHKLPQLATNPLWQLVASCGELWRVCGELWLTLPQSGTQMWAILWENVVGNLWRLVVHNLSTTRHILATTCPQFTDNPPQLSSLNA